LFCYRFGDTKVLLRVFDREQVGPKEEARMEATFTAARKGEHHVVINFQSSELTDIYGQFTITEPPTFLDNMTL